MVNHHVYCSSFGKAKSDLGCSIYFDQVIFFPIQGFGTMYSSAP